MKNNKPFKLTKVSEGVFFIDIYFDDTKINKPIWCLLRSDAHHDNPHSDNLMEKRHLDECVERKGFVLDNGDAFCAMQGKGDPRASKDDIKEEHKGGNYLDKLVDTYAEFLKPYAESILVMGKGNHESAVYKHRETDLTQRLVNLLNGKTNANIKAGQIANWIGIRGRTIKGSRKSHGTLWLYMFHGAGGEDPSPKESSVRTAWVSFYQMLILLLLVIPMIIGFCLMLVLGLPMMVLSLLMNSYISKYQRIRMNMGLKTQGFIWKKGDPRSHSERFGSNFIWGNSQN